MNGKNAVLAVAVLMIAGCSTTHPPAKADRGETVQVIYHVKKGQEAEFQKLLLRAWDVYRGEHLVLTDPHVIISDTENEDKTRFVEIFTWIKPPEHPPDKVKAVWQAEQSLCEARDGRRGIEGGEVTLIAK